MAIYKSKYSENGLICYDSCSSRNLKNACAVLFREAFLNLAEKKSATSKNMAYALKHMEIKYNGRWHKITQSKLQGMLG